MVNEFRITFDFRIMTLQKGNLPKPVIMKITKIGKKKYINKCTLPMQ